MVLVSFKCLNGGQAGVVVEISPYCGGMDFIPIDWIDFSLWEILATPLIYYWSPFIRILPTVFEYIVTWKF